MLGLLIAPVAGFGNLNHLFVGLPMRSASRRSASSVVVFSIPVQALTLRHVIARVLPAATG